MLIKTIGNVPNNGVGASIYSTMVDSASFRKSYWAQYAFGLPNLTPLDFLWGYLKRKCINNVLFETVIREYIVNIKLQSTKNLVKDVLRRAVIYIEDEGRHRNVLIVFPSVLLLTVGFNFEKKG